MKKSAQQTRIQDTLTYKLVCEEARELSWKLQNTMYVIYRNKSLFVSMSKEEGQILCSWNFGNQTNY
jgi:hypothetical protein